MSEDPLSSENPAPHPGSSIAPGSGLPSWKAAGYASLVPLVGGIFFYFVDRKDSFVRYHAVQSILLGLVLLVLSLTTQFAYYLLSYLWLIGVVISWVLSIVYHFVEFVWVLLWIAVTVTAFKGRQWQVPYLAPVVKRLSAKG